MTGHADPKKFDASAESYSRASWPSDSDLSSEAEAAFYAMQAIMSRIESCGGDNHTKAAEKVDTRDAGIATQVAAQNGEFKKPTPNEKTPRSRTSASLLVAGFLAGSLLGYTLLEQGIGLGTVADGSLAGHRTQSAPVRAAEDSPVRHQSALGHFPKFLVQIGSFKSQTEALAASSAFARDHPEARAHKPDIKTVDLGEMGVWHRLRLNNFADRRAASMFCEQLKSDGEACLTGR